MWNVVVMDGTEQQKFKGISTLNFIRRKRNLTSNPKFWERPATGWVKCNVDAAFYNGGRSAAFRMEGRAVAQPNGTSIV